MVEEIRDPSGELLHVVHRLNDFKQGRTNLIADDQFIQCSALLMEKGTTFRPHQHIWKEPHFHEMIAQESWVVIRGSVEVIFYDTNGEEMRRVVLQAGDASFTLRGGHNYLILEDDTAASNRTGDAM